MSTLAMKNESVEPAAIRAWTEKRTIYIELTDGRIIGFPASRFKILATANPPPEWLCLALGIS
jgi:hypothetical protein